MAAVSSDELQAAWQKVKQLKSLPEPPDPKQPVFAPKTPMRTRLIAIQGYLNSLEYNYTGTLYFDINKNRSFKSIVSTAKEITTELLPIQCLEGVFLGAYLTAAFTDLERFPVSFKSKAGSSVHRHIILAVRHQHKWGALGLSRCDKLMYKDLIFNSLSELVQDFCDGFATVCHSVIKVYIGFPFPHDIHSNEKVEWRVLNVLVEKNQWTEVASHLNGFEKEAVDVRAFKRDKGQLPATFATKYPLHMPEKDQPLKKSPEKRRNLGKTPLEFPPSILTDGVDGVTSPIPESVKDKQTIKTASKNPILMAPEELVFKRALSDQGNVLPTNIFLQNTTATVFTVEVEEPSGQLEIVTNGALPPPTPDSDDEDDENGTDSDTAQRKMAKPKFQVSAKGMIVIAIKYKHTATHTDEPESAPDTSGIITGGAEANVSGKIALHTHSTVEPRLRKGTQETKKAKGHRGSGVASPNKPEKSAGPAKNVVYFRCTPILQSSDDQQNELDGGTVYVNELPFTVA